MIVNLAIRTYKKPNGYLQVRYWENGKEKRKSFNIKYTPAGVKEFKRLYEPQILKCLLEGKPTGLRGKDSLKDYVDSVLDHTKSNKSESTFKTYNVYVQKIQKFFEKRYPGTYTKPIELVHHDQIQKLIEEMAQTGSKQRLDQVLSILRLAYSKAVKNGSVSVDNAMVRIETNDLKFATLKKITKPFSINEVQQIITTATGDLKTVIILCFFCGLRRSETGGLQWNDIDYERNSITIERQRGYTRSKEYISSTTKGKRSRELPLYPILKEYLESLPQINEWVISETPNFDKLDKELISILSDLGIPNQKGRLFHRFRHTSGSIAESSGETKTFVKESMGHSNIETTNGYLHVIDGTGAGSKVAKFFDENFKL